MASSSSAEATQTNPNQPGPDQPQTSSQAGQCEVQNGHSGVVVTRSAKEIKQVVSQAEHEIEVGNSSEAVVLLEKIQGDARSMRKETQHLIQQSEILQEHYKTEVEKSTSKISEVTDKKNQLEDEMRRAEIDLNSKQTQVAKLETQCSSAKSRRDSAREESNRQSREGNDMTGKAVGVGLFGLFLTVASGGVAAPFAVGAAAACSKAAADHREKEKQAEDDIRRYNEDISNINGKISSCNQCIFEKRREIQELQDTLTKYKEKCKEYERKKERILCTITFLQEAKSIWGELEDLIELRSIKTDILHKIIQKAESEENREFLQCQGTKTMVKSFVEAWDELREEAQNGAGYIFKVSFKCTQCEKEFHDVPSQKDGNFACSYCNGTIQVLES